MAKRKPRHIDWCHQFDRLDRYMDGEGGVVNVRFSGLDCGANAFLELLTATFETRGDLGAPQKQGGVSVRLQRANFKTKYLADLRHEFERKLGVTFNTQPRFPIKSALIEGNIAGRDQDIDVNLTIDVDPFLAAEKFEWIALLVDALRTHLRTSRMMIVLDSSPSADQEEFWTFLWRQAAELVDEGLLLVRMIDESMADKATQFGMCVAHCDISLTSSLSEAAIPHAIDDIASIMREYFPNESNDSLRAMARVYVVSHKDNVSALHNKLVSLVSELAVFQ